MAWWGSLLASVYPAPQTQGGGGGGYYKANKAWHISNYTPLHNYKSITIKTLKDIAL